jgi:hypothetical protein
VESWSAPGDRNELAASFQGWDPLVTELLEKVETCFWWGLYDRRPLVSWTKGRLALLGDAAHAMLPHLGQGANQAIEDGVALAVLLENCDAAEIAAMLKRYEQHAGYEPMWSRPKPGRTACATIQDMRASSNATTRSKTPPSFASGFMTTISKRPSLQRWGAS